MRTRQLRSLARVVFLSDGLHVRGPAVLNGICRETETGPQIAISQGTLCPYGMLLSVNTSAGCVFARRSLLALQSRHTPRG